MTYVYVLLEDIFDSEVEFCVLRSSNWPFIVGMKSRLESDRIYLEEYASATAAKVLDKRIPDSYSTNNQPWSLITVRASDR
jgi:hypothetical protein